MNILKSAIDGNYELIGDPVNADCIIGQSFGAADCGPGYVNKLLANYIIQKTDSDLPLLLQKEVAEAMGESNRRPSLIIEGEPSTSTGGELDTWQVLKQAREFMDEHGLNNPILVAQAYHIGRVCLQAIKQDMEPIVAVGLPRQFDPESTQFWTRDKRLWIPRELIGIAYLKVNKKL